MAEPRVRFKRDDGSSYPPLVSGVMGEYYSERNEKGDSSLAFLTVSIHSGISDGELDEDSLGKRVKRTTDPAQNKKVESGDLVFNMMRAWQGAVGCAKSAGMVSPAYVVACPDARIYPPYMDLYVKTKPIVDQFNRLSYGALDFRKRLYWDSFITTEINLPCIEEQQKIADFLSSVDEVITAGEEEVANLETQKKVVMKKIFSQEVRFKRADGSDFPVWEEKCLGDFARRVARKNKGNACKLPLTISAEYGLIDQSVFFNKTVASKDMSTYYLLRKGEFAFNKSTSKDYPVGAIKRLDRYDVGAVSPLYICFELRGDDVLSDFAVQYFETDKWHQGVLDIAQEGARTHGLLNISVPGFFETVHELPSDLEEQQKIADFLSNFDEAIAAAKKELELWKELKKGLLQQMFV